MEKEYVGTMHSVDAALYKITELISKGYSEEQISAVAYSEEDLSQLRSQTFIALDGRDEGNLLERFKAMFIDERQRKEKVFEDMGFSKEESANIYNEVKNGGIAIFVDRVNTQLPKEGRGGGAVEDTERDSRAALTNSFEPLSGEDDLQPRDDNSGTVPRINTDHL